MLLLVGMLPACVSAEVVNVSVSAPTVTPLETVKQASPTQPPLPTSTPFPGALSTREPDTIPRTVPAASHAPAPTAAEGLVQVQVGEFFVDPAILTIVVGTTVEWIPMGEREHTIVSKDKKTGWPRDGSVGMIGGPPFRATFREPGIYTYYCSVHPSVMDGEIIVIEAGSPTLFTSSPTSTPGTVASSTQKPPPSSTSLPQVEVVLVLLDCLRMFCVPEELENRVMRVDGKRGIVLAEVVSEFHARLVYDPNQLSEEEAVQTFISATNMEVRIDR